MSWRRAPLLLICLLIGVGVSVGKGQDVNYDLLNYHLANPFAVIHGRIGYDILPSGLQSYFNPSLDMIYYMLAMGPFSRHPAWLAAYLGLSYGGLAFLALRLAWRLSDPLPRPGRLFIALAAGVTGVTGAASLTQIGTVFNEVTIAMLVLWGVLLALPRDTKRTPGGSIVLGGGLVGLAAGLKLTAVVFAPAFCLAVLLVAAWRSAFRAGVGLCALFTAGWVVGFAIPTAWWGAVLYQHFGNPVFPMFNSIFRSEWYPPMDVLDRFYLPRDLMQWLFYPFYWVTLRDKPLNAELAYRDPRLAAMLVALVLIAAWWALDTVRRRASTDPAAGNRWSQSQAVGFWFCAIGYVLWLTSSSIMRYGIVLEVMGSIAAMTLLVRLSLKLLPRPAMAACVAIATCAACFTWTRWPDYGHIPFGKRVYDVDMSWIPHDALLITVSGPTAYLGVFVPESIRVKVIGFSFMNRLAEQHRLDAESIVAIRNHAGPIYVLVPTDTFLLQFLAIIGIDPALGECRRVESNVDRSSIKACLARRI